MEKELTLGAVNTFFRGILKGAKELKDSNNKISEQLTIMGNNGLYLLYFIDKLQEEKAELEKVASFAARLKTEKGDLGSKLDLLQLKAKNALKVAKQSNQGHLDNTPTRNAVVIEFTGGEDEWMFSFEVIDAEDQAMVSFLRGHAENFFKIITKEMGYADESRIKESTTKH